MPNTVLRVENLSKQYRLGNISSGTLRHDLQNWWFRLRSKESPSVRVDRKKMNSEENRQFWALKDVSFDVKQGEVLGIIGRNGAGKSTLLKLISRITGPTSGTIKIKGRIASLLEVGTGFHHELTGRENVFINGAIMGMTKKEISHKFDEIVAFAEVEKFIDTPVKRYSSGMSVRLAFAVAAHLEPEILIVDEVLAVGDTVFQQKCLGKMKAVGSEGRTVLFVSHGMGAVRTLCDRGLFLANGHVKYLGSAEEAIGQYISDGYKDNATASYEIDPANAVHITRVSVFDHQETLSCQLDMLKPFRVEIEYVVNEEISGVVVSCEILTTENVCVISSSDHDLDRTKLVKRALGLHQTSVYIPGYLLNSGSYSLVVSIAIPGKHIFDRREVLSLHLHDSGSFVVSGGGEGRRNSMLLLPLKWDA